MLDQEKVIHELHRAGIRLTPQRRAIIDYLASTDIHPNAQHIFHEVRKTHPDISLATIYNTLNKLESLGLVKMLEVEPDNRWETNLGEHVNLICTVCGKIQDMEGGLTVDTEEVLQRFGFQVLDSRMEYHGVCSACRDGHKS